MSKRFFLLMFMAIILLFAFNAQMPVTDPVESNYALTAKEMVQSGDWLSPQIYGQFWFDKPIFFYWLTALSYYLFGFTDAASRVAPALCSICALGFTYWLGNKLYHQTVGLYSTLILSACLSFFLIGKAIITDATLFFFFNACVGFFYLGYSRNPNYYYGCYFFAALSTLTKGPVGFLLPGLIFCIFLLCTRDWKALLHIRIFSGTALFLAVAAPWYYFMYATHGSAFTDVFLGTHNFLRATQSEHPRDNVFYYYTVVLFLGFFPWAAHLPQMLWQDFKKGIRQLPTTDLFLYIWAFTVLVFFQMMATKYATYTYPALLPLSLLLGRHFANNLNHFTNRYVHIFNTVFALALYFAYNGAKRTPHIEMPSPLILLCAIAIFILITYLVRKDFSSNAQNKLVVYAGGTMLLFLALAYTVAVPITQVRSGKVLVATINAHPQATLSVVQEYSASAVFYTDRTIYRLQEPPDPADKLSWNAKNVMPYLSPNKITQETILFARDNEYKKIPAQIAPTAKQIDHVKRWRVFSIPTPQ